MNDLELIQKIYFDNIVAAILGVYNLIEAWYPRRRQENPTSEYIKACDGEICSSEYISRRDVLSIMHLIVNICGITSIHWPQVLTNVISPENR